MFLVAILLIQRLVAVFYNKKHNIALLSAKCRVELASWGPVAQSVEHWTFNPGVLGSIPNRLAPPFFFLRKRKSAGCPKRKDFLATIGKLFAVAKRIQLVITKKFSNRTKANAFVRHPKLSFGVLL